jgi:hypothetical protein
MMNQQNLNNYFVRHVSNLRFLVLLNQKRHYGNINKKKDRNETIVRMIA